MSPSSQSAERCWDRPTGRLEWQTADLGAYFAFVDGGHTLRRNPVRRWMAGMGQEEPFPTRRLSGRRGPIAAVRPGLPRLTDGPEHENRLSPTGQNLCAEVPAPAGVPDGWMVGSRRCGLFHYPDGPRASAREATSFCVADRPTAASPTLPSAGHE